MLLPFAGGLLYNKADGRGGSSFSAGIDYSSITLSSNKAENPDTVGRKTILLNFCQRQYRAVNTKSVKIGAVGYGGRKQPL